MLSNYGGGVGAREGDRGEEGDGCVSNIAAKCQSQVSRVDSLLEFEKGRETESLLF